MKMILSSSTCSVPSSHPLNVNCDVNDTMDFSASNTASESSLSPSLTLQSPPPYNTPSFSDFPLPCDTFSTDEETPSTLPTISSPMSLMQTNTNDTQPSLSGSYVLGNDVSYQQMPAHTQQPANFAVGPKPYQSFAGVPVREEKILR